MNKYLIEVPHNGDLESCRRAVRQFYKTGSHFVTNAEWGCKDGDHKAWLIIEIESKEAAMRILPPSYRHNAKITRIGKFTKEEMADILSAQHDDSHIEESETSSHDHSA